MSSDKISVSTTTHDRNVRQSIVEPELLWKQYEIHINLYKFYMEQLVKLQTFYYGISGAILTYYFSNGESPIAKYSLLLPFLMSVAFTFFFFYGARLNLISRDDVFEIRDTLGLRVSPDLGVLSVILRVFALLTMVVAIGCLYILVQKPTAV